MIYGKSKPSPYRIIGKEWQAIFALDHVYKKKSAAKKRKVELMRNHYVRVIKTSRGYAVYKHLKPWSRRRDY